MQFLTGPELSKAIRKIAAGSNPRFAVAFWGKGFDSLVPDTGKNAKIICNLKMGGTNPHVIPLLRKRAQVKQCDTLHAKVYFNDHEAFITSANASANGMGLEGKEQKSWEEAGVLIDDKDTLDEIKDWFDRLWKDSNLITPKDISHAIKTWELRQASKPSLTSFAEIDLSVTRPLLNWWGHSNWKVAERYAKDVTPEFLSDLEYRISEGCEIEGESDKKYLKKGVWVLSFPRPAKGTPSGRGLTWVQLGKTAHHVMELDGKLHSVALAAEQQGQPPFPIDRTFRQAFRQIMQQKTFADIWSNDYKGAYYTPERVDLIEEFWDKTQKRYKKLAA